MSVQRQARSDEYRSRLWTGARPRRATRLMPIRLQAVSTERCPYDPTSGSPIEAKEASAEDVLEEVMTPGPRPFSLRSAWDVSKILRFGIHEAMHRFFEKYGPVCRSDRVAQWFTNKPSTVMDIALMTQRLALDVIGDVAFSHDFKESEKIRKEIEGIESDYGEDTDAFIKAVNDFGDVLGAMFILPMPVLNLLKRLRFAPLQKLEHSLAIQKQIMLDVIAERREHLKQGGEAKQDLLGSLLDVYDEDGNQMLDEELWEDVHDIMGAGHETTASALAACLYLISVHPEVEEKIIHELRTVLGGRRPTYDDVDKLIYTSQCVKETLRLYPPIPIFPREATKADQLPSGHRVNSGDVVFMAGYSLGHSTAIWEDAHLFNPDRFHPDHVAKMHRFQYCPFGGGNRMCIGPIFASMSMTLMTATIMQQLEFTAIHPTAQKLEITYDITMNFYKSNGLTMKVAPRYQRAIGS